MRRSTAATVAALGAGLLLTTCGDGADAPFTESEAAAAAQSTLLTLEDVAEGWTSIRQVEAGENPIDLPGQCQLLNDPSKDIRGVAEARSDAFINDPESVTSYSIVYSRDDDARDRIEEMRDSVKACRAPLEEQFRQVLEGASEEDVMVTIREFDFEVLPFTSFGDDSVAVRMTLVTEGPEATSEVTSDIIFLRAGSVAAGFDYATADREPDRALEERLTAVIEERARESAAMLQAAGND